MKNKRNKSWSSYLREFADITKNNSPHPNTLSILEEKETGGEKEAFALKQWC